MDGIIQAGNCPGMAFTEPPDEKDGMDLRLEREQFHGIRTFV
jgi:hypothetical protein